LVTWAGVTVLAPPREVLVERPFTHVALAEGEVSLGLSLNAVARWDREPLAANRAAGTVTSVDVASGDLVQAGAVLYWVDQRPVVAACGETPAFRDLGAGASGADVKQIQGLLADLGLFKGELNGKFDSATEAAVVAWRRGMGIDDDGAIRLGDIVFIGSLPVNVVLDTEVVRVGEVLAGGERAVFGLAPEPTFTLPLNSSQASQVPAGTKVEVGFRDEVWHAVAGEQVLDDKSPETVLVQLIGPDGASVCGEQCSELDTAGENLLPSTVLIQETVAGVVAPTAALRSEANGQVSVVDSDGAVHKVAVVASARGMSVIEGVPIGLRVRVPASDQSGQSN
jgi:hypothetical protein